MKRKRNKVSREGREAMARAGAANLQAWKTANPKANLAPELKEKLDRFERELTADLGGQPCVAERALIDSARTSYGVILLAFAQLSLSPGTLAKKKGLSGAIAAHQNSLLRALKVLGIRNRRPRADETTLSDVLAEYEKPEEVE